MLLAAPGLFTAAPGLVVAAPPLLLGWGLLGSGFHHPPAQAQRESTPPAAPTNLVVTNPGFGQININWQEGPTVLPQAGIYSYDVEYTSSTTVADDAPEAAAPNSGYSENRDPKKGWVSVNVNGEVLGASIRKLQPATYRIRVRSTSFEARKRALASSWVMSSSITLTDTRPLVTQNDVVIRNLEASVDVDKAVVSWDPPKLVADSTHSSFFEGRPRAFHHAVHIQAAGVVSGSSTSCAVYDHKGAFRTLDGDDIVASYSGTGNNRKQVLNLYTEMSGRGDLKRGCRYRIRVRNDYSNFPAVRTKHYSDHGFPSGASDERNHISAWRQIEFDFPDTTRALTLKVDGVSRGNGSTIAVDEGSKVTITLEMSEAATVPMRFVLEELPSGTATGGWNALDCSSNLRHREYDWSGRFSCVSGGRPIKSLHIPAGKTSVSTVINIAMDTLEEGPETIVLQASGGNSSPVYRTENSSQTITLEIRETSHRPQLRVGNPDGGYAVPTGRESNDGSETEVALAVILNRPSTETVTVEYETADGAGDWLASGSLATAGEDYKPISGTLTFAPGETRKLIYITILDDSHEDSNELFRLVLSNPQGAVIVTSDGLGRILNHEIVIKEPDNNNNNNNNDGDDNNEDAVTTSTNNNNNNSVPGGSTPSGSTPSESTPRPNNNNNNNNNPNTNPVDKNGVPLPVGQSDLRPTFGDITVGDQSYTQGMQIAPLTLPEGTGGNGPLTYALTPALPDGLMLDMSTRYLSGTPSMP
ncbi:MAG: hypothetical protein TQ37_02115, partial [Candidatus Synechococcus spongiarum 15L]